MRISLLYNQSSPGPYHSLGEGVAVAGVLDSVRAILAALTAGDHTVKLVSLAPPVDQAARVLRGLDADLVFNLFEGFDGQPDTEWMVARELESLGVPFTGASSHILALCLDKAATKKKLAAWGVPTPAYQLLEVDNLAEFGLGFPVIVKPLKADASHGCTSDSLVLDSPSLARQVELTGKRYGGPALIESFLPGRELNASVIKSREPQVLPLTEIVYESDFPGPRLLSFAAKWLPDEPAYQLAVPVCPARVPPEVCRRIRSLALEAHQAVGAPPYCRVDFRCDAEERPYVLEVNPNPDLAPGAGLALQAATAGFDYPHLIETLVELAFAERKRGRGHAAALTG